MLATIAAIAILVIAPGWAQTTDAPTAAPSNPDEPPNKPPEADDVIKPDDPNGFVVPNSVNDDVDVFAFQALEYLVVNRKRRRNTARLLCELEYHGQLAILADTEVAYFMAEALSETNLVLDALWIGGLKPDGVAGKWIWENGDNSFLIDPDLVKNFSAVTEVTASDRNCLAFARLDHDKPDYRALACHAQRAVLCQRQRGAGGGGNSTHHGWIKIGKRLYKIFSEQVPWAAADERCFQKDPEARLAVLVNYTYSQHLGRYLLVGRPSLENAWIGAKWVQNQYEFISEPLVVLSNVSNSRITPWPPWRNFKISKTGGCLLLDRHLSNITLFVEARCDRNRPFICYKFSKSDTGNDSFADVIIGDNGYRLHYARKTWNDSYNFCATKYEKYKAWLADILSVDVKYELLYVMGENRTAVQHIWIAGIFIGGTDEGPVWRWMRDKSKVNTAILDWVTNDTFNLDAEQLNICLDMDRENHIRGLHYGASCAALQQFVCSFEKHALLQLQDAERRAEIERHWD